MHILVLFDGAGLSRLGLEQAGHTCVGVELSPEKHYLSQFVGSGNVVLADVRDYVRSTDISQFDAIWASPPCQMRSTARTQGNPTGAFASDLLDWSLKLDSNILWVENVAVQGVANNDWGKRYNAAQFLETPIQNRVRIVAGRHRIPEMYRPYQKFYGSFDICPCITASEYKGCATDTRRASRWYGRRLTVEECAYHQGFNIPDEWYDIPVGYNLTSWKKNVYEAIGNGVFVPMAYAFGRQYSNAPLEYKPTIFLPVKKDFRKSNIII